MTLSRRCQVVEGSGLSQKEMAVSSRTAHTGDSGVWRVVEWSELKVIILWKIWRGFHIDCWRICLFFTFANNSMTHNFEKSCRGSRLFPVLNLWSQPQRIGKIIIYRVCNLMQLLYANIFLKKMSCEIRLSIGLDFQFCFQKTVFTIFLKSGFLIVNFWWYTWAL